MSGLSILCPQETDAADATGNTYIFDPGALTSVQAIGDACAICHMKWPRPQQPLGELPDGSTVFGCAECAGLMSAAHVGRRPVLAAH